MLLGIATYQEVDEDGRECQAFAVGILFFTLEFNWYTI
jgi:hypothetical protein